MEVNSENIPIFSLARLNLKNWDIIIVNLMMFKGKDFYKY